MSLEIIEPTPGAYQPGVCNIGPHEIAKRRAFGIAGLGIAAVLAIALVVLDAPAIARAIVLLPLWGSLISLEQARRKFCAGFAYAGIRSVAGSNAIETVDDAADAAADRAAARVMVAYCGAIALAITALFVLLPV